MSGDWGTSRGSCGRSATSCPSTSTWRVSTGRCGGCPPCTAPSPQGPTTDQQWPNRRSMGSSSPPSSPPLSVRPILYGGGARAVGGWSTRGGRRAPDSDAVTVSEPIGSVAGAAAGPTCPAPGCWDRATRSVGIARSGGLCGGYTHGVLTAPTRCQGAVVAAGVVFYERPAPSVWWAFACTAHVEHLTCPRGRPRIDSTISRRLPASVCRSPSVAVDWSTWWSSSSARAVEEPQRAAGRRAAVTRFVTRTRRVCSGFPLLGWFRLRLLLLVGDRWGVSEFSHNPSGRGFEPHPPHRLCG